ncbi:MAG: hypothetical protein RIR45_2197 [Pseudomonadota bacterium]
MPTSESQPIELLDGRFDGPSAFAQVIRDALACAAREGWSEMVWIDADFEDWPLRERAVVDSLQAWSRGGRRLVIVARSYTSVLRYQPRFVGWRKMWDHIVEPRLCRVVGTSEFPSALWSPHWAARRLDVQRSAGVAGFDPRWRLQLKELMDEYRKQSSPGFPASVLGL